MDITRWSIRPGSKSPSLFSNGGVREDARLEDGGNGGGRDGSLDRMGSGSCGARGTGDIGLAGDTTRRGFGGDFRRRISYLRSSIIVRTPHRSGSNKSTEATRAMNADTAHA